MHPIGELARLDDSHIERLAHGHAARAVLLVKDLFAAQGEVKLRKRLPWRETPHDAEQPRAAPQARAFAST